MKARAIRDRLGISGIVPPACRNPGKLVMLSDWRRSVMFGLVCWSLKQEPLRGRAAIAADFAPSSCRLHHRRAMNWFTCCEINLCRAASRYSRGCVGGTPDWPSGGRFRRAKLRISPAAPPIRGALHTAPCRATPCNRTGRRVRIWPHGPPRGLLFPGVVESEFLALRRFPSIPACPKASRDQDFYDRAAGSSARASRGICVLTSFVRPANSCGERQC
jgi:hypothetical protein